MQVELVARIPGAGDKQETVDSDGQPTFQIYYAVYFKNDPEVE